MVSRWPLDPQTCYVQWHHGSRYRNLQRRCISCDWRQGILLCSGIILKLVWGFSVGLVQMCTAVSLTWKHQPVLYPWQIMAKKPILLVFIIRRARRPGTCFQGIFVTHTISNRNTKNFCVCVGLRGAQVFPYPASLSTGSAHERGAAISKNSQATCPAQDELAFENMWQS